MKFFDAIKLLFPRARSFDLFVDSFKRRIVQALSALFDAIRRDAERAYMDVYPDTTRCPEKWENIFGVVISANEMDKRRNIIESLWKSLTANAQSSVLIQDVLQAIDPRIQIVENIPISNPRSANVLVHAVCNYKTMLCGNKESLCNYRTGDSSFTPTVLRNDTSSLYDVSDNRDYWGYCFFVCKSVIRGYAQRIVFVEELQISKDLRNYIEYLILKIKPVHTCAVIYINWI